MYQRKNFRELTFFQKLSFIFWNTLLASILLLLVGTLIWQEFVAEPPRLCIEMIDAAEEAPADPHESPLLMARSAGADPGVVLSKRIRGERSAPAQVVSPYPALIASILSEKNDLYFWAGNQFQYILADAALADLRQVLPQSLLDAYQEKLVYTAPLLEGGYPCAIALEGNWWAMENGQYDSCCVGVDRNAKNLDQAVNFLTFILG